MFLTRIEINQRRRATRQVLANPHRMHGAVTACFPRSVDPGRVMWRLDEREDGVFLFVLSSLPPDATSLVEDYGWPQFESPWQSKEYQPVLDAVQNGRQFQFRLRANPVRNVLEPANDQVQAGNSGSGEVRRIRGKRVGHVTVAQQRHWLLTRASRWGFTMGDENAPSADVVERKVWTFAKKSRTVTLSTAVFEGILTVTDQGELRRRLLDGFGPAKAYGCGLMTLAPFSSP
ncbi:type I-E CRISPR-associated protein Cas6/Cse3/CasE [Pseudactinotalea sp. Z1732]|uniref:type I-E CRISPR-associated protein Cas6/Cse3/CasE n=1 Tax=Pseudactinotalea sp. Z1732 TaxID=3413026 RepID=UPI003C7E9142